MNRLPDYWYNTYGYQGVKSAIRDGHRRIHDHECHRDVIVNWIDGECVSFYINWELMEDHYIGLSGFIIEHKRLIAKEAMRGAIIKCLIDADYILYDDGKVWTPYKKRFLKPYTGKNGYPYYTFKSGRREYIHRLLAIHFLGMEDGQEVNHKDFDRSNYSLDNLEVVSRSDNLKHAHTRSSRKKVESYRHSNCKLTDEQVIEIRNSSESQRKLAVKYGISARAVHNIKHRNTYQWVL